MKPILATAAALLFALAAAPAVAQGNAPTGTWNLNLEKSKFVTTSAPKSMIRIAAAEGNSVTVTYKGEAADGSPVEYSFPAHYDGKDAPVTGSGMPFGADTLSIKHVGNSTEATLKKGNAVVGKSRATYSADNKTITVALEDATGKPTGDSAMYEMQ